MKVLIIDDSAMDRKMIMSTISKSDLTPEFLEAEDGEDGMRVLSENRSDIKLILLDWQMPRMDGLEFMRGVVKVPEVSGIPIVMVTASGSADSKKIAYAVNPNLAGYVVKPYKPDDIVETIRPYLK